MNSKLNENSAELTAAAVSQGIIVPQNLRQTFSRYYPWVVISLCAFFLFYKYVLQVSPSVMTQDLMREFGVNGAGLGNLAATYFYAYLATQIFAGVLLDRFSPRYLTTFAILLCAFGSFAFANTQSLLAAEFSRALMGAGTAFATVSYMKMSALWFRSNQVAFVDGLLATAAMTGALCGQVPLTMLVTNSGWRTSLVYCGVFGLVFALLFLLMVKDRKMPIDSKHTEQKDSKLTFSAISSLLKDKKNWLLTFYSGLAFTPIAVLGGLWGNPFFEVAHHLTATQAAYFTSLIFIGLAIGGPLFGYFAGRGDGVKVMIVGTIIALISLIFAIYVTDMPLWLFGALLFTFGLGTGVFMLSFPLGKAFNPIGLAATVVALINTGDALFGSFTEPLIGKLLDIFWDGTMINGVHHFSVHGFHVALSLLPLYLLAGLACLFGLKKLTVNKDS